MVDIVCEAAIGAAAAKVGLVRKLWIRCPRDCSIAANVSFDGPHRSIAEDGVMFVLGRKHTEYLQPSSSMAR